MDVYKLILEQGYIGALQYANKIENQNYKLASKIDATVTRLYKNTRFAQDQNNPSYISPNYNPNEDLTAPPTNNSYTDQVRNSPAISNSVNPWLTFLNGGTIDAGKIQALKRGFALLYNRQLMKYKMLLQQGNSIEAIKILNNSPKDLSYLFGGNSVAIRSNFIQAAKDVLGPNSPRYYEFIHNAAGQYVQDAANTIANKAKTTIQKFFPGQANKIGIFLHPGVKDLLNLPGVTEAELRGLSTSEVVKLMAKKDLGVALSGKAISAAEYTQLSNAPVDVIYSYLKNNLRYPTKYMDAVNSTLTTSGLQASEALITNGAPSNVGKLEGMISKLIGTGSKFEFLAPLIKMGGKALGPIAVILDGKGFFEEYETYGWDGKTICDFVSVLLGAASIIPFLTEFAGPLWLISSIGCGIGGGLGVSWLQHGKPLNDKNNPQTKTTTTPGTFSSLSPKDMQLYNQLINENQSDPNALNTIVTDAISKGLFQNPNLIKQLLQQQVNSTQSFQNNN